MKTLIVSAFSFLFSISASALVLSDFPVNEQIDELVKLADEYAELKDQENLQKALGALNDYRVEAHVPGDDGDVGADTIFDKIDNAVKPQLNQLLRQHVVNRTFKLHDYPGREALSKNGDEEFSFQRFHETNGETLNPFEVVLTFDDGPSSLYTADILETLRINNVPATFFEVGEMVKASPEMTKAVAANGHILANHTWSHPELIRFSTETVIKQIHSTQDIIVSTIGGAFEHNRYYHQLFHNVFSYPREILAPEFFRSPYGSRNVRTMEVITGTKSGVTYFRGREEDKTLLHVMWNIDSLDWNDKNPASIERRVMRQLAAENNRGIILFHDIHPQTAVAIKSLIPRLKSEGFKVVTMYDLVSRRVSTAIPQPLKLK